MFTTLIPFPALSLLREAATPAGVPVTHLSNQSTIGVLNTLVDAGMAQATSAEGKAGYRATPAGLAELDRLDATATLSISMEPAPVFVTPEPTPVLAPANEPDLSAENALNLVAVANPEPTDTADDVAPENDVPTTDPVDAGTEPQGEDATNTSEPVAVTPPVEPAAKPAKRGK